MTKEWQEATNEYLKVRSNPFWILVVQALATVTDLSFSHRKRDPTPSTVLAARVTAGRVMYRVSRRGSSEDKVQQNVVNWFEGGGEGILLATSTIRGLNSRQVCLGCSTVSKLLPPLLVANLTSKNACYILPFLVNTELASNALLLQSLLFGS